MEIRETEWGIANNFGTYIEINKYLKHFPNLYKPILKHELSHSNKWFSIKDLKLDLEGENSVDFTELMRFMVTYPKSFTQLLPFYWTQKKGFVYDINLIIMYLTMGCVLGLTIYIGGKFI